MWKTIATAPKDGTKIIACYGDVHEDDFDSYVSVIMWSDGAYGDHKPGWVDWAAGLTGRPHNGHEEWVFGKDWTHWMYIPPKP